MIGSTKAAPTVKVKKMWHFSDLNIIKIDKKQEVKPTNNKPLSQNFVFLEKCSSKEEDPHFVSKTAFDVKEVKKVKMTLCRICLKEGTIPIHGDDPSKDLGGAISTCGGIDINIFDSYPKYLCESCHALLQDAILFRNMAQSSERLLKNSSLSEPKSKADANTKIEVSEPAQEDLRKNDLNSMEIQQDIVNNISNSQIDISFKVPDSSIMLDSDYLFKKLKLTATSTENATDEESNVPKSEDEHPCMTEELNVQKNKECIFTIRKYKRKKHMSNNANTQQFSNEVAMEQVNKSLEEKNIVLNCKDCDMEFVRYQDYRKHLLEKGIHKKSVKNKKCIVCKETDAVQFIIKYNPNTQKPVRMFLCEICSTKDLKTVTTECNEAPNSLMQQIKLKCKQCGMSFSTCQRLSSHICTHEPVKKPSQLFYKISPKTSFSANKKLKKMENKCVCDICGKIVVNLAQHHKRHIRPSISKKDLKFKCSVCPYKTHSKPNFKIHMRFHTGERPYLCDECPKRYVTKSNLIKHRYSHKSTRNFKCECGKAYHIEKQLKEHIKVDHNGLKEHVCEICSKAFGRRSALTHHQVQVHKREKRRRGIPPSYLKFESMNEQDSTS